MIVTALQVAWVYYFVIGLAVALWMLPDSYGMALFMLPRHKYASTVAACLAILGCTLDLFMWPWVIKSMHDSNGPWRG